MKLDLQNKALENDQLLKTINLVARPTATLAEWVDALYQNQDRTDFQCPSFIVVNNFKKYGLDQLDDLKDLFNLLPNGLQLVYGQYTKYSSHPNRKGVLFITLEWPKYLQELADSDCTGSNYLDQIYEIGCFRNKLRNLPDGTIDNVDNAPILTDDDTPVVPAEKVDNDRDLDDLNNTDDDSANTSNNDSNLQDLVNIAKADRKTAENTENSDDLNNQTYDQLIDVDNKQSANDNLAANNSELADPNHEANIASEDDTPDNSSELASKELESQTGMVSQDSQQNASEAQNKPSAENEPVDSTTNNDNDTDDKAQEAEFEKLNNSAADSTSTPNTNNDLTDNTDQPAETNPTQSIKPTENPEPIKPVQNAEPAPQTPAKAETESHETKYIQMPISKYNELLKELYSAAGEKSNAQEKKEPKKADTDDKQADDDDHKDDKQASDTDSKTDKKPAVSDDDALANEMSKLF